MKKALVRNGVVENVILVGPTYQAPAGCELVDVAGKRVGPGDLWDGQAFTSPPEPDPAPAPEPDPLLVDAEKATTVAALRAVVLRMLRERR